MQMPLSTSDRESLRKLQRNLCGSSNYARVTCILMLDKGYSPSSTADCLGIDLSTVYRYRSAYLHGGAAELLENRHKGYWGFLDSIQISALRKELREHVYTDSRSVARWIKIAMDCGSVNTESTKELYQMALEKHPAAPEIYIISDNARYYHNKKLHEWVQGTRTRQIFLPPYSPNLNLIERLWKFLQKKVINTGFYRTKEEFRKAIRKFFDNIGTFKEEWESLLTLNFRLCNSQTFSF